MINTPWKWKEYKLYTNPVKIWVGWSSEGHRGMKFVLNEIIIIFFLNKSSNNSK